MLEKARERSPNSIREVKRIIDLREALEDENVHMAWLRNPNRKIIEMLRSLPEADKKYLLGKTEMFADWIDQNEHWKGRFSNIDAEKIPLVEAFFSHMGDTFQEIRSVWPERRAGLVNNRKVGSVSFFHPDFETSPPKEIFTCIATFAGASTVIQDMPPLPPASIVLMGSGPNAVWHNSPDGDREKDERVAYSFAVWDPKTKGF
jgi:hypothetical protein